VPNTRKVNRALITACFIRLSLKLSSKKYSDVNRYKVAIISEPCQGIEEKKTTTGCTEIKTTEISAVISSYISFASRNTGKIIRTPKKMLAIFAEKYETSPDMKNNA